MTREQVEDSVTGLWGSLQMEAGLRFFFKGGRVRSQRERRERVERKRREKIE